MKKITIPTLMALALVVGLGFYMGSSDMNSSGTASAQTSTSTTSTVYMLNVEEPDPNDLVTSPLTVTGEARGGWYNEGTFPVELRNASGDIIALGNAQAQATSTTNEFVPFTVTLNWEAPGSASGTLVLKNANPSGLPQNAAQLEIPVWFTQQTPGTPDTGGRMFWWLNL